MGLNTNGTFTPTDEWMQFGNDVALISQIQAVTVVDPGYDPIYLTLHLVGGTTVSASYTVNAANKKPLLALALQYTRSAVSASTEPPPPAPPPGGGSSPRA